MEGERGGGGGGTGHGGHPSCDTIPDTLCLLDSIRQRLVQRRKVINNRFLSPPKAISTAAIVILALHSFRMHTMGQRILSAHTDARLYICHIDEHRGLGWAARTFEPGKLGITVHY